MQDKLLVLFIYGVLGLLLALVPSFVIFSTGQRSCQDASPVETSAGLKGSVGAALIAPLLLFYTQAKFPWIYFVMMVFVAFICHLQYKKNAVDFLQGLSATLLACVTAATLPWWRQQQQPIQISFYELILYSVILIVGTIVLGRESSKKQSRIFVKILMYTLYAAALAYLSYTLAATSDSQILRTLWHHWGAYIDPTDLANAGVRILYDIPAQYGIGPTLLIKAFCEENCWVSAYWVISTTTFVFGLVVAAISILTGKRDNLQNSVVLIICLVACTLWNSYPPAVSSPNITPSTNGLRFLPSILLVFWLLVTSNKTNFVRTTGGHFFWVVGAIWSPEALFYATAVWWPIYLFDKKNPGINKNFRIKPMLLSVVELLILAFATVVTFCLLYYFVYGIFPVAKYYIAYMLYPPGPLPINPRGPIWFWTFAMFFSVCVSYSAWKRTGVINRFRQSLALQLLAFAVSSYYLGRSHDNNILNVLPFVMLVLLDSLSYADQRFYRQYSATALSSLLSCLVLFGWSGWKESYFSKSLSDFGYYSIKQKLSYDANGSKWALLEVNRSINEKQLVETKKIIDAIYSRGESFVIMDQFFLLQPQYKIRPWCALESATNFEFFPSALRKEFIKNTANRLNRSGWMVIARSHNFNSWLDDFDSVYERTDRIDLDTVYAIRFSPRSTSWLR
jgi:hypothetical protein